VLIEAAGGRHRGAAHEARWLNLAGFCLRPGFGAAADAWRIGEMRKVYTAGLAFPREVQNQVEWLVLWQRVAGGFSAGQQQELARRVSGALGLGAKKPSRIPPQVERESWRLLAALERLDVPSRIRVGDEIAGRLRKDPRNTSLLWSLGRVGARVPFYGPLDRVVPADVAERWIQVLLQLRQRVPETLASLVLLAAAVPDMRSVGAGSRDAVFDALLTAGAPPEAVAEVVTGAMRDPALQGARYFGEDLPNGLRLAP
jgi:hypothetical protein